MPCVHPRRNSIHGVFVAKTSTSRSGMFAEIINVAAPKRVFRLRPAAPHAAPTSVWQTLSTRPLSEHLCFEHEDPRAAAPGIGGKSGFHARVIEESVAIPAVLGRHLRKEQATTAALLDDESMPPDFDLLNRLDFALAGEHRDLQVNAVEFLGRDPMEPGIGIRDGLRQLGDETGNLQLRIEPSET